MYIKITVNSLATHKSNYCPPVNAYLEKWCIQLTNLHFIYYCLWYKRVQLKEDCGFVDDVMFSRNAKSYNHNNIVFPYFSLSCADVNCDFVLILILYCTTTYYCVLFHWRCMYVWYVLLNSTYLLTYRYIILYDTACALKSQRHRATAQIRHGKVNGPYSTTRA